MMLNARNETGNTRREVWSMVLELTFHLLMSRLTFCPRRSSTPSRDGDLFVDRSASWWQTHTLAVFNLERIVEAHGQTWPQWIGVESEDMLPSSITFCKASKMVQRQISKIVICKSNENISATKYKHASSLMSHKTVKSREIAMNKLFSEPAD